MPASPTTRRQRRRARATRDLGGLPIIESAPSRGRISAARFAVFFTGLAWALYVVDQVRRAVALGWSPQHLVETGTYLLLVTLLTGSAVAYLLARLGHLYRLRDHRRIPRAVIDQDLGERPPSMTVLVPSYREEPSVIRQTLLSAALQEYADLRLVLLIDDPVDPTEATHRDLLAAARALPGQIEDLLELPRRRFAAAVADDRARHPGDGAVDAVDLRSIAVDFDDAAEWLRCTGRSMADDAAADHTDAFLDLEVFQRLATDLSMTAGALRSAAADPNAYISRARARQLRHRLVAIFSARVSSFERKQFASLSHEANKAMNLNSYLGLMGGHYSAGTSPGGRVLLESSPDTADLSVPDTDYVLTLDADSVLLPEYCLRLVHAMEQPDNADVAVIQTPYSAYRGAPSRIERMAGATTDIQHIAHQGFTHYGATFWVGANAVLRKTAIDTLRTDEVERGFEVSRYIADRTVIEDTESSIDLRTGGWRLTNFPERLSYSATPPDYGSLVVQRKRWANGGLVILPKMLGLLRRGQDRPRPTWRELFLRTNYLGSIAWSSLGLLVLLLYPFDQRLLSLYAVAAALPYFIMTASDLRRCGYHRRDVFGLYGFNLLLLPVSIAGATSSIVQAIGGQKVDFARTPKVRGRTAAPLAFVLVPLVMLAWSTWSVVRDVALQDWIRAGFAGLNSLTLLYAVVAFIGLRAALVDVLAGLREYAYVTVDAPPAPAPEPTWASVVYLGAGLPEDLPRSAPLATALAAGDQAAAFRLPHDLADDPVGAPSHIPHATSPLVPVIQEAI